MVRCIICCITDTRPDTPFVDGTCMACINFKRRTDIDWAERLEQLKAILLRNGPDVIVTSSGGKDSTYQVLKLLELGAKPIVVTASTCHLTPIGRANIDNLARYATTIEVTPNRSVRSKLNKVGLETVGDISWPEHVSIFTTPFRVASQLGIGTIFYGESPQAEYGGPLGSEVANQLTRRWRSEFGGFLGLRPADCAGQHGITEHDMADYILPSEFALRDIKAYFLGQFIPWDSHHNAAVSKAAGMTQALPSMANYWDHENLDNAQTGLHDHACYRKYGYGRLAAQVSVDVRNRRMERAEAMDLVEKRDGLFPHSYAGVTSYAVFNRLGITRSHLMSVLDRFTNWDLFDGVENDRPILKEFRRQEAA